MFLKSDLDKGGLEEYVLGLTSLAKDLSRSLSQQLGNVTEIIQDTCHLLSALHDKPKELTGSPEYNGVIDYLQKVKEDLTNTILHLQEAENKFYDKSCSHDGDCQNQTGENVFGQTDVHCSEGEATEPVQASSSSSQQFQRTPTLNKPESQNGNQTHTSKIKTAGKIASLAVNKSAQEEDTITEKPPELAFQDALTSSEEDILSGSLKDIHDRSITNNFEQEKKEVVMDNLKVLESEDHKLTEKMEDSKMEKNNDIFRNYLSTFTPSAQTCDLPDVNPSMSDSEEVQKSRYWMDKEFLVKGSGKNPQEIACFIKAPATVLENLKCNILNYSSSLVVDDSEELVSNVISIECYDYEKLLFPINIAIPFISCFRGNYREIMVKVTDTNFQSNYLTPISFQRYQGNHKESFAEVKIYHLGVFSVLSCLKKETFTVPKVGLLQKLNMDSRISFCYHPEAFSSPAPMQLKIQPIEPSLVSALKARHDMYHSVISTSALVHVQHPSAQPFNSSVTITLPCPPNPDKKRQGDETEHARAISATVKRVGAAYYTRAVSTSVRRSGDNLSETLKLLGHGNKKEGWKVFDDVIIQNAQNGLVYFEINEHLESFVVIRLAFPLENRYLLLFAQALEEALRSTMANVILYQKREDPYKIVVLLSASRELTNELQNLHEEGYFGPPEPTQQFPLRQGEQIHFIFRGNIYASENGEDFRKVYRLIFHSQRQPRLEHQIKEVDEFGNHSSPHYKGTAVFYKITKEMIPKKWEQTLPYDEYQHQYPLCKLALTLPKHEKLIHHPRSTKRIFSDSSEALWDKLLFWLAEELAEDNTSLFALCLPVRRSVLQLVSLKCPDNLTHQIYELLCCWNKTLPKSADKQQLLSRYLQKSGRSDLSEELRLKWQNKVFT
uniref:death domain-containing protein 1 n=1 Tax=Lonchura striata TaxID=40157 RepID=UPI000B4D3D8B|nr:death domain-containing protein 1 [Lonchura striata domestica]